MRGRCAHVILASVLAATLTVPTAHAAPDSSASARRTVAAQSVLTSALSAASPRVSGVALLAHAGLLPGGASAALAGAIGGAPVITDALAPATAGWTKLAGTPLPAFRTGSDVLLRVDPAQLPYARVGIPALTPQSAHDDDGVLVFERAGRRYDHPVLQARHIPMWTAGYRNGGGPEYLAKAVAHGERLLQTAEHARGALYFPYLFDFALHGDDKHPMRAPWYSAMAQGQALSAFVALYEVTGQARWKRAADETFVSFLRPRVDGQPWTVDVDDQGLLWFEEYAGPHPDHAFNGHNFALFGVYDYWWLTGDARARQVVLGGLEATRVHARDIAVPGGTSLYCLTHRIPDEGYHRVHIGQLYTLFRITGSSDFAQLADQFADDAPRDRQGGPGVLTGGTQLAVRLDDAGQVVSESPRFFAAAQHVEFGARSTIPGRSGVWLRVDSGELAGSWVRENPELAWLSDARDTISFGRPRAALLGAGEYVGYGADPAGSWVARDRMRLATAETVLVAGRQIQQGRVYLTVADGPLAGLAIDAADVQVE